MSTMCDGAALMSDEDETLVLNYLDDDLDKPESPSELVDENQNTSLNLGDVVNGLKPRGRGRPKGSKNKAKGLRASKTRQSNGPKASAPAKDPVNGTNGQSNPNNIVDIEFKIENFDDALDGLVDRSSGFGASFENIVKREPEEEAQVDLKYESMSDAAEAMNKKKLVKKSPKTSPKNHKPSNGQSSLDTFLKVVDLKPQSKLGLSNVFKCNHCLYVGNSKANLERHNLIHMDPNDILWYKCSDCDYKSKYESQLKSHTLIHKNPEEIEYFQCPHCELKCSRKHNLSHHIRSIHADRVNNLKCAECSYSTFSKDRLVAHVKMHSKEVFMCTLCKFVTKRIEYLESHFKMKHTNVEKPFPCDTCSYKGKTKRELDRHYDRMHNKDTLKTYQCSQCSFNSIYKKNLEFHLLHMHQNSEGFQKFICGHCDKTFAYKNGLKTHIIRIHLKLTDEDWHNFATNRKKSMVAHMNTHDITTAGSPVLKCPDCPYRIILTVSFLYHMKTVHGKSVGTKDLPKYHLIED
ncbi:hypothetical protein D910_03193 [Dendroctonus ponderosae]|uniref:C2H2-type domain-containing protein n=1 Tax=Dendroctonus ponderosae TaxID=77166 RepID=U4U0F2_DENPD|nr:hypothetical protein D910_03193 [Dendroctonus ponderosae]